jgi:parallel beta-helix repeat protein
MAGHLHRMSRGISLLNRLPVSVITGMMLVLVGLVAGPWLWPASAAPPNDWVISSPTVLQDSVKQVNGDVIIENGGQLSLTNSTLVLNCTKDGEFQILVKEGGRLKGDDANLTAGPSGKRYWFHVNGSLELTGCQVSGTRGQFDTGGIYLSASSTAAIKGCHLFDNQWYAVIVNGSSPEISGCSIDAVKAGIRVENRGAPTISGNTISGAERQAIMALNSDPVIRNNRILGGHQGIDLERSKAQISGNEISGCQFWGIQCYDFSDSTISGNAVTGCAEEGISVVSSSPNILANTLFGNAVGVNSSASSASLTKNTIAGNRGWGVFCRSGAPTMNNNNFTDSSGNGNALGDVAVVWSLTVLVEEQGHGPVPGAEVSITDSSGKTVFKGKTGDDGAVSGIELFQYRIDSGDRLTGTPHKIMVRNGGLQSSSSITMDRDQVVTAKLVKNSSGMIPGPAAAMTAVALALAAVIFRQKNMSP